VGISGEGRDLLGVRISKGGERGRGVGKKAGGKMGFVITGAQHAREVSTSSFPLFRIVSPYNLIANSSRFSIYTYLPTPLTSICYAVDSNGNKPLHNSRARRPLKPSPYSKY
jgi:Zinc carboxypeptidase